MPSSENPLVGQYVPLVRRQALLLISTLPANIELDDLMQAGMIGLLDAIRRYQQRVDAQFETYAITRIRGAMLDELRSQDWLPRSVRSKARRIEEAIHTLNQRLMRPPTEGEIADEMGLDIHAYQILLEEARGVQILMHEDLRQRTENVDDYSLIEGIADTCEGDPVNWLANQGLRQALVDAIGQLPEREQLLLSLQFVQDLNQKEIAAVLEVSEGRVSQLRSQAIARIRAWLAAHSWEQRPEDGDYQTLLQALL